MVHLIGTYVLSDDVLLPRPFLYVHMNAHLYGKVRWHWQTFVCICVREFCWVLRLCVCGGKVAIAVRRRLLLLLFSNWKYIFTNECRNTFIIKLNQCGIQYVISERPSFLCELHLSSLLQRISLCYISYGTSTIIWVAGRSDWCWPSSESWSCDDPSSSSSACKQYPTAGATTRCVHVFLFWRERSGPSTAATTKPTATQSPTAIQPATKPTIARVPKSSGSTWWRRAHKPNYSHLRYLSGSTKEGGIHPLRPHFLPPVFIAGQTTRQLLPGMPPRHLRRARTPCVFLICCSFPFLFLYIFKMFSSLIPPSIFNS